MHHTSCPRCKSKDNVGVYTDGHEYCFGCGWYKRGHSTGPYVTEKKVYDPRVFLPKDLQPNVDGENYMWLKQYLTDEDIEQHFEYSPTAKRHYWIYHKGEVDCFIDARNVVDATSTKSLTYGERPYHLWGKWKESRIAVVVEDIVSAIKLSHKYGVVCLHGTYFPKDKLVDLARKPEIDIIVFWLDWNKRNEAMEYSTKLQLIKSSYVINTQKDPKALTYDQIEDEIEFLKLV